MADVERDPKLHILGAFRGRLVACRKRDRESPGGHSQRWQQRVCRFREFLRGGQSHLRQLLGFNGKAPTRIRFPRSEVREIELGGVDQVKLTPSCCPGRYDILQRRAIFFQETEQPIAPPANFFQACWVELDRSRVVFDVAGQLLQSVKSGVEKLLHASRRRIDPFNLG